MTFSGNVSGVTGTVVGAPLAVVLALPLAVVVVMLMCCGAASVTGTNVSLAVPVAKAA